MTMHSGTLPDCVSVHITHPVMYTLKCVEGVQCYLNSAHIKTQPGVVASSKLVPFEIQQTSWNHDASVRYQTACQARAFQYRIMIFAIFMDNFVMSLKPQVMTVIKHHLI